MSHAAVLFRLQELEADIDDKTDRLKRVQAALRGSRELAEARKAVEVAEERLEKLEAEQRKREMDLKALEQEIEQKEQHLYSGRISNPKELEAYQRDLEHARRRREKLDEAVIRGMDELDEARRTFNDASTRLEDAEAAWQQRKAELTDLAEKLKRYIARARQKRDALRDKIPAGDLAFYEETAKRKGGLAVAKVKNRSCGVCGVSLSHGKLEAVRRGNELITCGNCDRILTMG